MMNEELRSYLASTVSMCFVIQTRADDAAEMNLLISFCFVVFFLFIISLLLLLLFSSL